jgi:protein-disulfide isomerase-like protein with CxxC motif
MSEVVQFSFDPRCPWCYQTSRWILRLEELGCVELRWGMFCLELNHFDGPHDEFDPDGSKSAPALRTAVVVRDTEGQAACGRFYAAIGRRYFFELEDLSAAPVIRSALVDADLDPGLYDRAIADPETWSQVRGEHERLVDQTGGFGVPTLRLDAGEGPSMFGPVITEVPSDDEALELFEHTTWLIRNANFLELKRGRAVYPDLPHIKKALADRVAVAVADPSTS